MFLRFGQILGISSGYLQGMLRVGSSMFRVSSYSVQSVFRVCSECVHSVSFHHLAQLVCQFFYIFFTKTVEIR